MMLFNNLSFLRASLEIHFPEIVHGELQYWRGSCIKSFTPEICATSATNPSTVKRRGLLENRSLHTRYCSWRTYRKVPLACIRQRNYLINVAFQGTLLHRRSMGLWRSSLTRCISDGSSADLCITTSRTIAVSRPSVSFGYESTDKCSMDRKSVRLWRLVRHFSVV